VKKLLILVAALIAVAVATATATAVTKPIAFTGKYTGTATTQTTDTTVAITANGTGKAVLLGVGKVTGAGTGDSSQRPCVPFTGTGKLSGTGGTLVFKVNPSSVGCGDDAGELFSISGKAAVLKGTGKLAKAKGTLKLTGTYDRSSGAFSVKFTGSLTH
jgi:hypothetical protein